MTKVIVAFRNFANRPKSLLYIYQITALINMCELLQSFESYYRWRARAFLRNKNYLDDHGNLNKRMMMCLIHLTVFEVTDRVMDVKI
jgi:hypothetical protein